MITYKGKDMVINGGKMGEITSFLYDKITGIQSERYEDEFVGPVIGTHVGAGMVALIFLQNEKAEPNDKELAEE